MTSRKLYVLLFEETAPYEATVYGHRMPPDEEVRASPTLTEPDGRLLGFASTCCRCGAIRDQNTGRNVVRWTTYELLDGKRERQRVRHGSMEPLCISGADKDTSI